MGRPTISDLAKEANVGLSTVDRVINGRSRVKPETAQLVLSAAEKIGFHATHLIRERLKEDIPIRQYVFLIQQKTKPIYEVFGEILKTETENNESIRGRALIVNMEDLTPTAIAEKIEFYGKVADGVAVVAPDHPYIVSAINELSSKGVPVVTLLSDVSAVSRAGYVGLDGRKVGRTAGWFMEKLLNKNSKVAVFVGSYRYQSQEAIEMGLRSYFRENTPTLHLLDTLNTLESDEYAYHATVDLLHQHPDLAGIMIAGGGSAGIIKAVKEIGIKPYPNIIALDFVPITKNALEENLVQVLLTAPLKKIAQQTVEILSDCCRVSSVFSKTVYCYLPIEIITKENV